MLDKFIEQYLERVGPLGDEARDVALAKIRQFLEDASVDDFSSADDFAKQLLDQIETAYEGTYQSSKATAVIKRTTAEIYKFYRLKDATPFAGESPIKLKLGGPDTRAVKFFEDLDHFYFSTFADNTKQGLKDFLKAEYLDKGAALFGRGTPESIDDFRKAAGGKLDNINDFRVETIIHSSVQRIRNYAHINSLRQARFEFARIRAIHDNRCTTLICPHLDGKLVRVKVAAGAVDRLTAMEPGEYALELYKSELGRAFSGDPVAYVKDRVGDDGVIDDSLVEEGRGFPPFHPRCRCRLEGVFD